MTENPGTRPTPTEALTLRIVAFVAAIIGLLFGGLMSLLLLGLSSMCTDDFDDSDCGMWRLQAMAPLGLAVVGMVCAIGTLSVQGRTALRVLAAIPVLIVVLTFLALA